MPCLCDTTCVILSRFSFATGQYLRVASFNIFPRSYMLPFSGQSIELLMQTKSILSPSSGIIFSILLLFPTHFSATRSGVGSGLSPLCPPSGICHAAEEAVNVNYFISICDFEVQEIGFKSNDCMKESKSVKTSPSSLVLSSIAAIVSSLA